MIEKGKYLDILKKIYNTITSEVHSHNYFICDYHVNSFNNPKNDEFLKLLNLIEAVINQVLKYLSSVTEEKNLIMNEIEKYKNNINDLQVINDNLINENNEYKIQIYNNDYSKIQENMNILQENYDKCAQMNQILEKKIKNYETEFELKQMQINSLEEMVKRRNNNNLNSNTENNNTDEYQPGYYNNSYNSSSVNNQNKTIQRLEQDREKLIKDNMKLIQYNKKLKEQINSLNQIINNLTMNNNNNNEQENNDDNNINNNEEM